MATPRSLMMMFLFLLNLIPDAGAYRKFTEMVPMTDGTSLATDIYWPDVGDGPWHA